MKKFLAILSLALPCFAHSISEDKNQFPFSAFYQMEKNTNLVFSPYSISTNLTLLHGGSSTETAEEIEGVLNLENTSPLQKPSEWLAFDPQMGYRFHVANALFPHHQTCILPSFIELARDTFEAEITPVNFSDSRKTLETINGWISQKTEKNITTLITEQDINPYTRLILANALFFEGNWDFPFLNKTRAVFYPPNQLPVEVEMLEKTATLSYFEDSDLQCVALPFQRNNESQPNLECILVLPKEESLNKLESHLSSDLLSSWLAALKPTCLTAQVPKFRFSQKIDLSSLLQSLGMKKAFTNKADFSKINGMNDLYLDRVIHETMFSFHESGVTATAATTSQMGLTSIPSLSSPKLFCADHPFLFFIVDTDSEAILFMGRFENPPLEVDHED